MVYFNSFLIGNLWNSIARMINLNLSQILFQILVFLCGAPAIIVQATDYCQVCDGNIGCNNTGVSLTVVAI